MIINTKKGGGGTTITDGIVIKSKDANGFPTELDIYGDLWRNALSYDGSNYHDTIGWTNVTTINLKSNQTVLAYNCFGSMFNLASITGLQNITTINAYCLAGTKLEELNMPLIEHMNYNRPFNSMTSLKTVYLPKVSGSYTAGTYPIFGSCTALETVQIGSIGYGITNAYAANPFSGCTQSGLIITVYTNGATADSVLSGTRAGATNATIIIKASEATTYGGTSYAAGDTMLTSTPT